MSEKFKNKEDALSFVRKRNAFDQITKKIRVERTVVETEDGQFTVEEKE